MSGLYRTCSLVRAKFSRHCEPSPASTRAGPGLSPIWPKGAPGVLSRPAHDSLLHLTILRLPPFRLLVTRLYCSI